ncbi:MAG TPA: cytochrome c [Xanthobacteraceae bacterium]|jgi:cytochrome c|nr:cytochrome c [Xanthobacteraceae bacterium]
MSMRDIAIAAACVCVALVSLAPKAHAQAQTRYGFGAPASPQDFANLFSIPADGSGLPAGSGTAAEGAKIYADNCSACHGDRLEGNPAKGIGGDKLIGGRGTLATATPVKTVESYWPYATTLFDYIKRAMPFSSPGSLNDDQVYGVVAYILSQAKIIDPTEAMNATSLPKVEMPNRDGFEPDPRPELELYR